MRHEQLPVLRLETLLGHGVIITSRANPEHRGRAKDLGVRALVAKPITRRKLLEALTAR